MSSGHGPGPVSGFLLIIGPILISLIYLMVVGDAGIEPATAPFQRAPDTLPDIPD